MVERQKEFKSTQNNLSAQNEAVFAGTPFIKHSFKSKKYCSYKPLKNKSKLVDTFNSINLNNIQSSKSTTF
jgi:hypothetical protein